MKNKLIKVGFIGIGKLGQSCAEIIAEYYGNTRRHNNDTLCQWM